MTVIQDAKGILAGAEKSLRDLMRQELRSHSYRDLAELARLADGLSRLAGEQTDSRSVAEDLAQTSEKRQTNKGHASTAPRSTGKVRPSSRKWSYPRFERDADKLIKIGWSKKAREEYEHRAPRAAALAFVEHIGSATRKGKTFTIEELLPVRDAAGDELPSYQVYLALAWLRQAGAIEKKGRDGYVRIAEPLDGSTFDTLWDHIPERS